MLMLNRVALPAAITLAFLSAVLAAWGTNDNVVVLGKRLMAATIFAFVFCGYFEERTRRQLATDGGTQNAPPGQFLIGSISALAIGAIALSTLSNEYTRAKV